MGLQPRGAQGVHVHAKDEISIWLKQGMSPVGHANDLVVDERLDHGPFQEPVHRLCVLVDWKVGGYLAFDIVVVWWCCAT